MSEKQIIDLIEYTLQGKIKENENYIKYTFYELRVKYNLTDEESDTFLNLIRNKLEKMNYNVYFTNARYTYKDANCTVQDNELMIAIK